MLKHNWFFNLYLVSCLTNTCLSGEGMRSSIVTCVRNILQKLPFDTCEQALCLGKG